MSIKQPNAKNCFVCGVDNPVGLHLSFEEQSPGEVTADCILEEKYEGYPGIVHGGIVASMLDEISSRALMGNPDQPRFPFTARINVRYRKHVPVGQPLHLRGWMGKDDGKRAVVYASISDQAGNVLAESESLMVDIPPEMYHGLVLEDPTWKRDDNKENK